MEKVVKLTFLSGFSDQTLMRLWTLTQWWLTSWLMTCAEGHMKLQQWWWQSLAEWRDRLQTNSKTWRAAGESTRTFKRLCSSCQSLHMIKDCKEPNSEVLCYWCDQSWHIAICFREENYSSVWVEKLASQICMLSLPNVWPGFTDPVNLLHINITHCGFLTSQKR